MPFELKQAPFHPHYGYNSPHLPLGTDPDYDVAPVYVYVEDPEGESEDSEPVVVEDPAADVEPVDAENHEIATPDETHSPDEGDIVGYSTVNSAEVLHNEAVLEELETSQNEYRSDDPMGLDELPEEAKEAKVEEVLTSQNEYRADSPEDYLEASAEEAKPEED